MLRRDFFKNGGITGLTAMSFWTTVMTEAKDFKL